MFLVVSLSHHGIETKLWLFVVIFLMFYLKFWFVDFLHWICFVNIFESVLFRNTRRHIFYSFTLCWTNELRCQYSEFVCWISCLFRVHMLHLLLSVLLGYFVEPLLRCRLYFPFSRIRILVGKRLKSMLKSSCLKLGPRAGVSYRFLCFVVSLTGVCELVWS